MLSTVNNSARRQRRRQGGNSLRRQVDLLQLQHLKAEAHWPPPPLPTPFRGSTSLRYQAGSAATAVRFNYMSLARLMCYTTTTTNAQSLLEAVKINRLQFWLPPYTNISGTSSSIIDAPSPVCSISIRDAASGSFGTNKDITLTSGEKGAYYSYRPRGIMGQWITLLEQQSNEDILFLMVMTDCNPIVQVDFSYQLIIAQGASTGAGYSIASVVDATAANAVVFLPLDNYLAAGTEGAQNCSIVGLATATVNDPSPKPTKSDVTPCGPVQCTSLLNTGLVCQSSSSSSRFPRK